MTIASIFSGRSQRLSFHTAAVPDASPIIRRVVSDCEIEALYENAPERVLNSDGQLSTYDRLIYYWSAKEFYSGNGTIVDAGALVGGSTCVLAEGLLNNAKTRPAKGCIHVYDLFVDQPDGYTAKLLRGWYEEERNGAKTYDFERHFRRNTTAYARLLTVHRGDIATIGYTGSRPIEILSIDVAKSADLMHYVAREFFPKLLTGHSVILHQDYVFVLQPWLHIAMEMLSDLVDKVYDAPTFCTAVFVPAGPIREADVLDRLGRNGDAYFNLNNARYLYQAIEKAETHVGKILLTASLAYFYLLMGRRRTANLVARRLLDQYDVSAGLIARTEMASLFQHELGIDVSKICR